MYEKGWKKTIYSKWSSVKKVKLKISRLRLKYFYESEL